MSAILGTHSPTILLRISDATHHMHRAFTDFFAAMKSAEAFAGAGFSVSMVSATGKLLMTFEPRVPRAATSPREAQKACFTP
jgi:hypothetical protein